MVGEGTGGIQEVGTETNESSEGRAYEFDLDLCFGELLMLSRILLLFNGASVNGDDTGGRRILG